MKKARFWLQTLLTSFPINRWINVHNDQDLFRNWNIGVYGTERLSRALTVSWPNPRRPRPTLSALRAFWKPRHALVASRHHPRWSRPTMAASSMTASFSIDSLFQHCIGSLAVILDNLNN